MKKYKGWILYECLPKGWKVDNTAGSPLFGYDFCTDGKSIINGGKRALVKTIYKGAPKNTIYTSRAKETKTNK